MIPTAIIAGFALALWLRWWAVPVVAVGWAIVIAVSEPSSLLGALALGGINGLVGAAPAIGVRHLARARPRNRHAST